MFFFVFMAGSLELQLYQPFLLYLPFNLQKRIHPHGTCLRFLN